MTNAPENSLDKALRLAASDASYRPEFYDLLLASTILIIGHSSGPQFGYKTLQAGESLAILKWKYNDGSSVVPFFTSLEALRRAIDTEVRYMELPARAFFEITKGDTLVLNPKSSYGKEFFPNEIEALLAEGVNISPERKVSQEEAIVLLGQPREYPIRAIEALSSLFARRSNVKAAYLALMHGPSFHEKPCLLVGINADGDTEKIIRDAGLVISDTHPGQAPFCLILIEEKNRGLGKDLTEAVKPFYERENS